MLLRRDVCCAVAMLVCGVCCDARRDAGGSATAWRVARHTVCRRVHTQVGGVVPQAQPQVIRLRRACAAHGVVTSWVVRPRRCSCGASLAAGRLPRLSWCGCNIQSFVFRPAPYLLFPQSEGQACPLYY